MKVRKKIAALVMTSLMIFSSVGCSSTIDEKKEDKSQITNNKEESSWKEDYANLVGQQALIHGFPAAKFGILTYRYNAKAKEAGKEGAVNTYDHAQKLLGPEFTGGTSMNRDTLYSIGTADITDEPMVFTIGDNIDGRYYSIEFVDWYTDCIGYMGNRTTNDKAAAYLVHAPGWEGEIPEGIDKVIESPTNWIAAIGRTFTTNTEEDLKIAHQLQEEYKIYPISEWGKENPQEAKAKGDIPELPKKGDVLAFFDFMNTWMKMASYPAKEEEAMIKFSLVGLGPKVEGSVKDLDVEIQKGLMQAYAEGMELLDKTSFSVGSILDLNKSVNGWTYNPANWGRMAETDDYLGRAATQSYSGGLENLIEEAVKLRTFTDENGENLNGSNNYVLKFKKDQIPQVDAFWSITLYNNQYNVVANDADKYEIRDIDKDLKYGEDGSLSIYFQSEKPEDENANWLPTPEGVDFNLFFRAYLPGEDFINQTYEPPMIVKIK